MKENKKESGIRSENREEKEKRKGEGKKKWGAK